MYIARYSTFRFSKNLFSSNIRLKRTFSTKNEPTYEIFKERASQKLWGGRFSRDTDPRIKEWTESVTVDRNLVREDLWGSMAHVIMLGHQQIIPPNFAGSILKTLEVRSEIEFSKFFQVCIGNPQ